jgi:hypothetical protein
MEYQISLAQRDLQYIQISEEIKNKKKLLLKKNKELEKKEAINEYLSSVRTDYAKYNTYILQEKQKQYDALVLINQYMGDLIKTEKLVDSQLRTAKHDQKDILGEIEKVKAELDELIS